MERIEGYVEHIIYRNEDNGYTVFELIRTGSGDGLGKDHSGKAGADKKQPESVTCTGCFPTIGEGEMLSLEGSFTVHPSYGEQFRITAFEERQPTTAMAMERYLGSGVIKGVRASLAGRIVRRFGEDTFRIMEQEPERLSEIKGISERMAREIAAQVEEKREAREAFIFLSRYGISNTLAMKIYSRYGEKLYAIFRENPYRLADDIDGVGFKTADAIARKAGIRADADFRIRSGVFYVLNQAAGEGHVYLPAQILQDRAEKLLETPIHDFRMFLTDLAVEHRIVVKVQGEETRVYAASLYYTELNTARMLCDLAAADAAGSCADSAGVYAAGSAADEYDYKTDSPSKNGGSAVRQSVQDVKEGGVAQERRVHKADGLERSYLRTISRIEKENGIQLDEIQRQAVLEAAGSGVLVLTGGPGTGKTTTINTMIALFLSKGMEIALAAPTGRAAKRMTEATGYEARTIHRLLEVEGDPENGSTVFGRNREMPLEYDAVIVDEMSMVDIYLMHALLTALVPGTKLIMVGDAFQLPSVGPGSVLRDIIDSGIVKVVRLERIFRQDSVSDIVLNAHRINQGEHPVLDNKSRDFFFLRRGSADAVTGEMIPLIARKLPGYVKVPSEQIQVLTPTRKGVLGVEQLNALLQRALNPASSRKAEYPAGDRIFRQGDKVMQIKNNYQLEWEITGRHGFVAQRGTGIYNGDIGTILEIDREGRTLCVEFDEHRKVTYPFSLLEELEHAWAVTVHKSQGSEYPAVIIPLLGGPKMLLNRNLLYTAVTRAASCVVLIGDPAVFHSMIDNTTQLTRYTSLREALLQFILANENSCR